MKNKYFILSIIVISSIIGLFVFKIIKIQLTIEQGEINASIGRLTVDHNHMQSKIYNFYYGEVLKDTSSSNPGAIRGIKICSTIINHYREITKQLHKMDKVDNDSDSARILVKDLAQLIDVLEKDREKESYPEEYFIEADKYEEYFIEGNKATRKLARMKFINSVDAVVKECLFSELTICRTNCIIYN